MHLVIGGTGFLGAYVVRDLLTTGQRVAVYDLHPDAEQLALTAGPDSADAVTIVRGDTADGAALEQAAGDLGAEVIVHLASPVPPDSERDASDCLRHITQAQINVLESARKLGTKRVVWASALSVFGTPDDHGGPEQCLPHDAPHFPRSLYGIAKSANERLARLYWERHGVDSLGFRFGQGYGPGKRRGSAFSFRMFEAALTGKAFALPYGDDVINWQYGDDMAALLVAACTAGGLRPGTSYNTMGDLRPMREAACVLQDLAPTARIDIEPGRADLCWRLASDAPADAPKLAFATPIEAGFARTLETLRRWATDKVPNGPGTAP
ncbi:MAG: NAD(P)-dependent oxidoreductase [Kiloniellales bacterium]|nr:NAD(P)-dependent oxidoreductase [Kiloniellales bacterium]